MSACVLAVAGCMNPAEENELMTDTVQTGVMSVNVKFDDTSTKSQGDLISALDQEKLVKKIDILVFDKMSGMLNAHTRISSIDSQCQVNIPTGKKIVYAIVNGPSPVGVTKIEHVSAMVDELVNRNLSVDGLTLVGSQECEVVAGTENEVQTINVRWLVSRVVLTKVTCSIPEQYGSMMVDCVYLGNAYTTQTFAGEVSEMVNNKGCSPSWMFIGQQNTLGSIPTYLYRQVDAEVAVGASHEEKYYMYCQPNNTQNYTYLYMLATIGGTKYYYAVPLDKGVVSKSTGSVELKVTNFGSTDPKDVSFERGSLVAKVAFGDWTAGDSYVAEF